MAVACCGAAAVLAAIAMVLRMEVRLDLHQLVLRWGSLPAGGQAALPPPPTLAQAPKTASPETEEQLRLLSQLIHALADTAEARDSSSGKNLSSCEPSSENFSVEPLSGEGKRSVTWVRFIRRS